MSTNPTVSLLFPVSDPSTGQHYYVKVTLACVAGRLAIRLDCERPIPPDISDAIHESIRESLAQDGIGSSHVATLRPAPPVRLMGGGLG